MKPTTKILLQFLTVIISLIFTSCEKDLYEDAIQKSHQKRISFSQFKSETKVKEFETLFRVPLTHNGAANRSAELSDFIIDTLAVQKYVSENNKTTYSFRIYSLATNVEIDEKYNLVYTKVDDNWEKTIIAFKERLNATASENQYEEFVKIYDTRIPNTTSSAISEVCFSEYYFIQCDGSCHGQCDGFACPTGQCIQHVITVDFCGSSGGGITNPETGSGSNPGDAGYIPLDPFEFSPNLFDNPVYDNVDYINACKANHFFSNLSDGQKLWVGQHLNSYHQIVNYMIANNWSPESIALSNQVINEIVSSLNTNNLDSNVIIFSQSNGEVITNMSQYLSPFNLSQSAVFTIYVDQPTPNSNESWSGIPTSPDVGHTFISIKQGDLRRVLGFYPSDGVSLDNPSVEGAYYNDSGHHYDVALSFVINSNKLTSLINHIYNHVGSNYNLNTNNCTDFGMGSCNVAGVKLPSAFGTWGMPGIGSGGGDNPGQLGQNIRNMTPPIGSVLTTTSGNAPSNSN